MNGNVNFEGEIIVLLKKKGFLSVVFIIRFLNEMGVECICQ